MKKTVKKLLSGALAFTMVVPALAQALAFLPISFAAAGEGVAVYEGNVSASDEDRTALKTYIQQYFANGTTLDPSKLAYFSANMFDYDRVEYNTATLNAELKAIYEKMAAATGTNLLDSNGNAWDYQLDGVYFWDPNERWDSAYWDAYEDFGGVDLVTGFLDETVNEWTSDVLVTDEATGATTTKAGFTFNHVIIPDGAYVIYSPRADARVSVTDEAVTYGQHSSILVNGSGLDDAINADTEVFYFTWHETNFIDRWHKSLQFANSESGVDYKGYYTIQVGDENGPYVGICDDGTSTAILSTVQGEDGYLEPIDEHFEEPYAEWKFRFNIFKAEYTNNSAGNVLGNYIIKAGGDFDYDSQNQGNWYLNDYGAAGSTIFSGWEPNTDYYEDAEHAGNSVLTDNGNKFNLYPVENYDEASAEAVDDASKSVLEIKGLSGTYAMWSADTYDFDGRRSGRLVSVLDSAFDLTTDTFITDANNKYVTTEGYTVAWKFIEVGPGVYNIEACMASDGFERSGYYLYQTNSAGFSLKQASDETDGLASDNFRFKLYRYLEKNADDNVKASSAIMIVRANWTDPEKRANDAKDMLGYNVGNTQLQVSNGTVNQGNNQALRLENVEENFFKGENAFRLYDITSLSDASIDGKATVDMRPYFCATYDYTSSNPVMDWNAVEGWELNVTEGIVSGIAMDTMQQVSDDIYDNTVNIGFNYPTAGLFDVSVTQNEDWARYYQNVKIPYVPVKKTYNETNYTTYLFDAAVFGAYFDETTDEAGNTTTNAASEKVMDAYVATQSRGANKTSWLPFDGGGVSQDNANYQFGLYTQIPFEMTTHGGVIAADENSPAIEFNFDGDDDVWVFIDGELVLDIGGIHGAVSGTLDFQANTWTVHTHVDSSAATPVNNAISALTGRIFKDTDVTGTVLDNTPTIDKSRETFAGEGSHVLTIYYVERGSVDSNCHISFNFPMSDNVTVTKEIADENGNALTAEEEALVIGTDFEFVLYKKNADGTSAALANEDYDLIDRNGNKIGRYKTDADGKFLLRRGEKALFLQHLSDEDGETYYVTETMPAGYGSTVYTYSVDNALSSDVPETKTITDEQFTLDRVSGEVTAIGDAEKGTSINFVCTNYWGLSDIIVIDYGLLVELNIKNLPGWKNINESVKLSGLRVFPSGNYLTTTASEDGNVSAQYGTVTFKDDSGVRKFEAESGIKSNDSVTIATDAAKSGGQYVLNIGKDLNGEGPDGSGYLTYTVNSPVAAETFISLYYMQDDTRDFKVTVNGTSHIVECQDYNSWTAVSSTPAMVKVSLNQGDNTIVISGNGGFAPNLDYFTIALPGTGFYYQLTEQMTKVEALTYTVNVESGDRSGLAIGMIYVVPATVMHYEENFKEAGSTNWRENWVNYLNDGDYAIWEQLQVADDDSIQDANIVDADGNDPYGFDDAYAAEGLKDSNGSSMHVTTTTEKPAQFSYTFSGTGTSFFARTGANSGFIRIEVADNNQLENGKPKVVYTYYRDTQYINTNSSTVDDSVNGGGNLFGIPLFTWDAAEDSDLGYGNYTVTVTVAKDVKFRDDYGYEQSIYGTEFWLDGIRIFNPLDMTVLQLAAQVEVVAEVEENVRAISTVTEYDRVQKAIYAYRADTEYNPNIITVRDKLLTDKYSANGGASWESKIDLDDAFTADIAVNGVFTDTNSKIDDYYEMWLNGPKEEIYIDGSGDDQSVTFYLPLVDADGKAMNIDPTGDTVCKIYLGMKAPFGSGSLKVNDKAYNITNATECYYGITADVRNNDTTINGQQCLKVTVTATDALIALTNIRIATRNVAGLNYSFEVN